MTFAHAAPRPAKGGMRIRFATTLRTREPAVAAAKRRGSVTPVSPWRAIAAAPGRVEIMSTITTGAATAYAAPNRKVSRGWAKIEKTSAGPRASSTLWAATRLPVESRVAGSWPAASERASWPRAEGRSRFISWNR